MRNLITGLILGALTVSVFFVFFSKRNEKHFRYMGEIDGSLKTIDFLDQYFYDSMNKGDVEDTYYFKDRSITVFKKGEQYSISTE